MKVSDLIQSLTEADKAKADKSVVRSSADSYTFSDHEIYVNLGLQDLQRLLKGREIIVYVDDEPKGSGRKSSYRLKLKYKGKRVPRSAQTIR